MKNNKGITLVALVVTIIVLIILAGVSISLVFGQDGIIAKAKKAAKVTEEARIAEEEELRKIGEIEEFEDVSDGGFIDDPTVQNEEIELSIDFNGNPKIMENTKLTLNGATKKGIKKIQLFLDNVEILTESATTPSKRYTRTDVGMGNFQNIEQVQKFGDCTIKIVVTAEDDSTKEQGYTVKNYTVGNAACLNSFATVVNNGDKLTGETIIQLNDITTTNHIPIGYIKTYNSAEDYTGGTFEGIYDGRNHTVTINGFNIPSDLTRGIGIFGNIKNATIKNVTCAGTSYTSSSLFTGGVCGNALVSTFENCKNSKPIVNSSKDCTAGICACADRGTNISYCENTANITGYSNTGGIAGWYIGDMVRCANTGNIIGNSRCTGGIIGDGREEQISYCTNSGTVTSSGYHTGGITGNIGSNSEIIHCSNTGNVSGSDYQVGGICGIATSTGISYSKNSGSVSASVGGGAGIVGQLCEGGNVAYCTNSGSISSQSGSKVGGIVGEIYGNNSATIEYCYNLGNITTSSTSSVAGILGGKYATNTNSDQNIEIKFCYNKGTITAASPQYGQIGGIVGLLQPGNITNCYNLADVTNNSSNYPRVGGICGGTSSYYDGSYYSSLKSTLSTCYNSGNVQGNGRQIGGITGILERYCTITNCYIKNGTTVKYSSSNASYDVGTSSYYHGKIVGENPYSSAITIGGNSATTSTNYGTISNMPTVFAVVSGSEGSLNNGTESDVWVYDTNNLNQPKLKWEI